MKKLKLFSGFILPIIAIFLLVTSCDLDVNTNMKIGGDTDFVENQVGATSKGYINLDGTDLSNQIQTTVVENKEGIVSVKFTGKIPTQYASMIDDFGNTYYKDKYTQNKSLYVDANGNVNATVKLINSSEGLAYVSTTGKQFVVMKYNAKVGDKWEYTKKSGKSVNFEVTEKSTTDDYPYVFFDIKVVKVEQTVEEPGFSKIIYIGNHKFGLVGIEIYIEDGTVVKLEKV